MPRMRNWQTAVQREKIRDQGWLPSQQRLGPRLSLFRAEPLPPTDYQFRIVGDTHVRRSSDGIAVSLPRVRFLET